VKFFFKIHDPTTKNKQGPDVGKKYRSIVFYKNKSQQSDYMQVLNSLRFKQRVVTELLSASKYKFHIAEKFHQQYINKKKGILTENITVFENICMKNITRAENKYSGRYTKEPYLSGKISGIYQCPLCHSKLYSSENAYDSKSGWPAFSDTIDGHLNSKAVIYNSKTKELVCGECSIHLGHRYVKKNGNIHDCINSVCLHFVPKVEGGGNKLPELKPTVYKKASHRYKLTDNQKKRRSALDSFIRFESRKMNRTLKQSATKKKARLNILRIYRKNKDKKGCEILTKDMKYLDRKYKLGETNRVCK
jgi:peptide methionine sulfoxide reductase MsrB